MIHALNDVELMDLDNRLVDIHQGLDGLLVDILRGEVREDIQMEGTHRKEGIHLGEGNRLEEGTHLGEGNRLEGGTQLGEDIHLGDIHGVIQVVQGVQKQIQQGLKIALCQ